MKQTKKLLSVILALIMLMTSVSVCFTCFGESGYEILNTLVNALDNKTISDLSNYVDSEKISTSIGSGKDKQTTITTNIVLSTYDQYITVMKALDALNAVIVDPESDWYTAAQCSGHSANGNCLDFAGLQTELLRVLQNSNLLKNRTFISEENIQTFFSYLFTMDGVTYTHSNPNKVVSKLGTTSCEKRVYNKLHVYTEDYKGYLAKKDSYENVPSAAPLGFDYEIGLRRESYSSGIYTFFHSVLSILNTDSPTTVPGITDATTTNNEIKTKLDNYIAFLDGYKVNVNGVEKKILEMNFSDFIKVAQNVFDIETYFENFYNEYDAIVDYVGGKTTFNNLFDDYAVKVNKIFENITAAPISAEYITKSGDWVEFQNNYPYGNEYEYQKYTAEEMAAPWEKFLAIYNEISKAGEDTLAYLNGENTDGENGESVQYISLDYYNNFKDNIEAYKIAELKDKIDALYEKYKNNYTGLTAEEYVAAKSLLEGYLNEAAAYSERLRNEFGLSDLELYTDLILHFDCESNEYVLFFADVFANLDTWRDKKIRDTFNDEIGWRLDKLNEFYASLGSAVTPAKAEQIIGDFVAQANNIWDIIKQKIADRYSAQINVAYDEYNRINSNTPITDITYENFAALHPLFTGIDEKNYEFLDKQGALGLISEETNEKYEYLKNAIYDKYNAFKESKGFNIYQTETLAPYDTREVYPNDKIKKEVGIGDYKVTNTKLTNAVDTLDNVVNSDFVKNLLGGNDLGSFLTEKLQGIIYTDSFINTVVNLLYPLVLKEFQKAWAKLPDYIEFDKFGIKDPTLNYTNGKEQSMYAVLSDLGLALAPYNVAQLLNNIDAEKYAENITKLNSAYKLWNDESICQNGKLTLKWGVDDAAPENKEAAFYEGFSAAMEGLKPLVMTLMCGQQLKSAKIDEKEGTDLVIRSEKVTKATILILNQPIGLDVDVLFRSTPNDGFNNALVPIFEAAGYMDSKTADDMKAMTDLKDVGHAIFDPIFAITKNLGTKTVSQILQLLPNIAYAMNMDMIPAILDMLNTTISYKVNAYSDTDNDIITAIGSIAENNINGDISIAVGSMLDLEGILKTKTSNGLNAIISAFGINLPEIDTYKLAALGELKTQKTKRTEWIYSSDITAENEAYCIEANKEDVLYFILQYVIDTLKDEDALKALLGKFMGAEQIDSIVGTINSLHLKTTETGDSIAALVELANADKYPEATFEYKPVEEKEGSSTENGSALYTKYWTKEKAQYVADNLVEFAEKTAALAGYDITGIINDLISSVYTGKTLEKLAEIIGNALTGILVNNGTINSVLKIVGSVSTLDSDGIFSALDMLNNYTAPADFKDGDKEAFIAELKALILPLVPVLKLFLIDSNDGNVITILDKININGYNGYNTGLIPVLEAIGCEPSDITPYAEFINLDDNAMVDSVLNPIVKLIDKISEQPIDNIIKLIPNIMYFVATNGLQTAIDNLMRPLYVLLDAIRPIVDTNVNINVNLNELLTDLLASANLKTLNYDTLAREIQNMGTATYYTSANGNQNAIRLDVDGSLTPDLVTLLLYTALDVLMLSDNVDVVIEKITSNENLTEQQAKDIEEIIRSLLKLESHDQVLFVLFYIFFGVNEGYETIDDVANLVNDKMTAIIKKVSGMSPEKFGNFIVFSTSFLQFIAGAIEDAASGSTEKTDNFFQKLADFFNRIFEFFKTFFKFGK